MAFVAILVLFFLALPLGRIDIEVAVLRARRSGQNRKNEQSCNKRQHHGWAWMRRKFGTLISHMRCPWRFRQRENANMRRISGWRKSGFGRIDLAIREPTAATRGNRSAR